MATPAEKLAISLDKLKAVQDKDIVAIKSTFISRTHRERLEKNGFLREVSKSWYIATAPAAMGDTTSWYSNYWEFCGQLLNDRFGKNWCLSPEQSLLMHGGNTVVPTQLIIRSPKANNAVFGLLSGTSLFLLRSELPPDNEIIQLGNIQLFSLAAALIWAVPKTYTQHPVDTRAALAQIKEASGVLGLLLNGGHSTIAGRLAGAFRNIHQDKIADDIIATMSKAGYDIRESDPFDSTLTISLSNRQHSPYANRIKLMWEAMRATVIAHFPATPGLPADTKAYLKAVDEVFVTDAYHSLSIEKYIVTADLIEKVRQGTWNAKGDEIDRKQRDAMAAKGYWDAFQAVEQSIGKILTGSNAGKIAEEDHGGWYRELFGPSVTAGLLKPADLAGYRNHQEYIGGSLHTPLNKEALRDAMPVLFDLLKDEKEASVRATLGHFTLVFIHPYMDGNGRIGRFLMNVMLASGGYPWTVIPVEQREAYMQALEQASVYQNIEPFTTFLAHLVKKAMEGKPVATI
jgi:hypothetical protein